ncbi:YdcF family protein [Crenobacter cavernae]|uniref:YdcF family protein n=1 Tax=Crenobacter cavernae TaxID=2290923 RepID=A0ABY0FCQ0_9NEIS|nr:YdcF family protein [Crenobacter cavernae]RXZ42554.1 YdcF family protein [Crenobacter cavernae]
MATDVSPLVLVHQLVGAFFLPPLLWLWPMLIGALFIRRGWRKLGRALWVLAFAGLYLAATPQMALWLARGLETDPPISADALASVDAIVVLGGGKRPSPEYGGETVSLDTLSRVRYGAWLSARSGKPLLVTGGAPLGGNAEGSLMAGVLENEFKRPVRWCETASNTTQENAQNSAKILLPQGVKRIALVSQAWHLRRAVGFFREQGLAVVPAPTGFIRYDGPALLYWVPQGRAMQEVYSLTREYIGMLYYALRGQLAGG